MSCFAQETKAVRQTASAEPSKPVWAACGQGLEERAVLQRARASEAGETSVPPIVHEVLSSPGQPLEEGARRFMESRLGHDFGRVRVHADERATRSAREVGALAYTVGPHVVFQQSKFSPDTRAGKKLLAHELAHVVQQGETSTAEAADAGHMLQRQTDGETNRPAETPTPQPAPPTPQPAPAAPAAQPAQTGGESTVQSSSTQTPPNAPARSNWTPDVPYIWFDLHDIYKSIAEPSGPYLYSSRVYTGQVVNPNFSNSINPGPVRDTTTLMPGGGRRAAPSDLQWFFYTKFFVDSAASPLPPSFTRFETSADIVFTPTGGGTGFEDHFADNNPQYLSPGGLSFPFALGTTPYAFRAQHTIMQPGTLQWNALLRAAMQNSDIPLRIVYTAPPQVPNETVFRAEIARRGLRLREPASGEAARTARLTFTIDGAGSCVGNLEILAANGTPSSARRLQDLNSRAVVDAMALVMVLSFDNNFEQGQFGSSSDQHVEIRGSQRVRFERPSPVAQTP